MTTNPPIARRSIHPDLYRRVLILQTWLYQRGIHYHCDFFGQCCPGRGCCVDMQSKRLFGRYAPLRIPSAHVAAAKRGFHLRMVLDGEVKHLRWYYFTPICLLLKVALPAEPAHYRRFWQIWRVSAIVSTVYIIYSLIYIF